MQYIEVLVPNGLEEDILHKITAVDPRVKIILVDLDRNNPETSSAEVLLRYQIDQQALLRILHSNRKIRWVHSFSAGVEKILPNLQGHNIILTNSAGLYAKPISEWVAAMMFIHSKKVPQLIQHHESHEWKPETGEELENKTLGIIGAGGIGTHIASKGLALGMKVIGIRSTGEPNSVISKMYNPFDLLNVLPLCDYVVVSTPLTSQTRGLIGERELRAMRTTGVLLNIARGAIIQTDALIKALDNQWIAAAYLDVTDPEPLPPEHPLWSKPNVLITAHTSGYSERNINRLTDFFCENLRRWIAGEKLMNIVDMDRGY